VHFGLGDDQEVSLEIHWPSGKLQHLSKMRADQQLQIDEPV
jgi:ASPIC and UnbV